MNRNYNYFFIFTRLIGVLSTLLLSFLLIEPSYNSCTIKAKSNHIIVNGEACKQILERQVSVDLETLCQKAYRESLISVRECTVKTLISDTSSLIKTIFIGEIYNDWFYRIVGIIFFVMVVAGFWQMLPLILGFNVPGERIMNVRFQPDNTFMPRRHLMIQD